MFYYLFFISLFRSCLKQFDVLRDHFKSYRALDDNDKLKEAPKLQKTKEATKKLFEKFDQAQNDAFAM